MVDKKIQHRKGQQEIFGFAIIVMLILVIAVIFFGFALQRAINKPVYQQHQKVNNLLFVMMKYTTTCRNLELSRVIELCMRDETCSDDVEACDYLAELCGEILNTTLGNETQLVRRAVHGYWFRIADGAVLNISAGNLSGNIAVGYYVVPLTEGSVTAELWIYY